MLCSCGVKKKKSIRSRGCAFAELGGRPLLFGNQFTIMMAASDEFRLPKLAADNYHTWCIRARAALVQKGCWDAIEPGYSEEMTDKEKKVDNKALTFLFLVVEDNYLDDIGKSKTAREAWMTLQEMHSKFGLLHILQLMRDFFNVKMKKEESMQSYLGRLMELHRKLSSAGHAFTDREVALVMLMGLPAAYEPLILNLEQDEEQLSTKVVKTRLLIEEKRKLRRNEESVDNDENQTRALVSKTCSTSDSKQQNEKMSYQPAHKKDDKIRQRTSGIQKKKVRCFACGKIGHIARDCDQCPDEEKDQQKKRSLPHAKIATHTALCAKDEAASHPGVWHLDSGATDHMTSQRSKVTDFMPCESAVETANRESMKVKGKGRVKIQLSEQCGGTNITLEDVLYVPALNGNLLSVGRIEERGLQVTFAAGKAFVSKDNGEVVLTATKQGRLYTVEEAEVSSRLAKAKDTSLWHRRLGHLHQDAVRSLCGTSKDHMEDHCDVCRLGKLRRRSFPKGEATRAKAPLELIHSDVVGKIMPTSKGGSSYFVTFTDDYSRYTVVYPMKAKSEVLQRFEEYRCMAENFHDRKVKVLRSDNGGEYTSTDFNEYLTEHGIRHQLTIPGTPEQNGVAERINQTLLDMTRCLLIESGVPKELWADAVVTASRIRNKCPSKAIEGKSPEALWTGGEVKLDSLRVFGCRAWSVRSRLRKKGKLDPKAEECVLVGYPEGVKGYKLWNLEDDRFFVSRDVSFDEGYFPCKHVQAATTSARVCDSTDEPVMFQVEGSSDDPHDADSADHSDSDGRNNREAVSSDEDEQATQQPSSATGGSTLAPRRSERLANKEIRSRECPGCCVARHSLKDPETLQEALAAPDKEEWKAAMQSELDSLKASETWELVPRPKGRQVVKCKWVFRRKYDANGDLERYKARLVACGYSQVEGIDFKETFSPVVKLKSIRTLLAIAVEREWKIHQVDITAAYLNGTLKEAVYMEQPKSSRAREDDKVCLLKKSLYGLRQSGREWNLTLDSLLKSEGMTRSKADPCVYVSQGKELIVGVYVDDLLIIAKDETEIANFKSRLGRKFDAKDLGEASHILSMRLKKEEGGKLSLDQTAYAEDILETFGMTDARPASSPLDPGSKYEKGDSRNPPREDLKFRYRQAVGALLYLAGGTRPDIAFATAYMSQFNEHPTEQHWSGIKHILRYIKGTKSYALVFRKAGTCVQAFCDADWASDRTDRKSFSGYVFTLAGAAISWSSRKQRCTALSTVEAEYVAMCQAAKEALWLQQFLGELSASEFAQKPQVLKVDNQGAIALAKNQVTSERSKHIDLKYFFLRENIEEGRLQLKYVESSTNSADLFTKPLNGKKTHAYCECLGVKSVCCALRSP